MASTGYRMPGVVCGYLQRYQGHLARFFGSPRLRLLDFCCGFGTNGMLLRHEMDVGDLFAYFAKESTAALPQGDADYFASRRRSGDAWELGGLDIAEHAVGYALACGHLDEGFTENLLEAPAGPELDRFMKGCHVVFEAGAVLDVALPALERLYRHCDPAAPPWLLIAPRCDVDDRALWDVLAGQGLVPEKVNRRPIRYRRLLGEVERILIRGRTAALGKDPEKGIEGDWLMMDLYLARPPAAAARLPLTDILLD